MNPATRQVSGFFLGQLSPSPIAFTTQPTAWLSVTTPRSFLRSWSEQSEVFVIPLGNDHLLYSAGGRGHKCPEVQASGPAEWQGPRKGGD